jgi:hypothetical protein
MLAAVLLLMLGLQALLLSGSFTMGVYCLLLTCAIMIGETFVPSHFDMDPSNAYIDLIGRNLEAYMHRGTFYLLASLPIFLSRQPSWPGFVLAIAGVRYLLSIYYREDLDIEAGDAGVPLMSTVYQ